LEDLYPKIMELAKRRGFFWPSYEIYGGVAGFYDLGPYGPAQEEDHREVEEVFCPRP